MFHYNLIWYNHILHYNVIWYKHILHYNVIWYNNILHYNHIRYNLILHPCNYGLTVHGMILCTKISMVHNHCGQKSLSQKKIFFLNLRLGLGLGTGVLPSK